MHFTKENLGIQPCQNLFLTLKRFIIDSFKVYITENLTSASAHYTRALRLS